MFQRPDLAAVPRIGLDDALRKYEAGDALFVDARNYLAYERGHIPGALLLPLIELTRRIQELPHDRLLVFYCT